MLILLRQCDGLIMRKYSHFERLPGTRVLSRATPLHSTRPPTAASRTLPLEESFDETLVEVPGTATGALPFNSISLVAGNAIGAGVLALPETSLPSGFLPTTIVRTSNARFSFHIFWRHVTMHTLSSSKFCFFKKTKKKKNTHTHTPGFGRSFGPDAWLGAPHCRSDAETR